MRRTAIALIASLTLAACGGGDGDAADGDGAVEVTAVDYAYEGLPSTVPVGTELTLTNASDAEVHEIVLVSLPDDEERSVPELLEGGEEQLMPLVMQNLVGVSVAPPNSGGQVVEGNLVLNEAGRYMLLCVIPTGADPDEFMAAAAESEGGPPDVEGGPPHIAQGMFAELTAES